MLQYNSYKNNRTDNGRGTTYLLSDQVGEYELYKP